MQKEADFINVPLNFVEGSNQIIESLVSGDWDDKFIILEPNEKFEGRMFLEI